MLWAGKLGYAEQVEVTPGVWEEVVTEIDALGELLVRTEALDSGDAVLPQYRTTTSVSVLSDGKRVPNAGIMYLTLEGERWGVSTIQRKPPRLEIYLGGRYNGPTPE